MMPLTDKKRFIIFILEAWREQRKMEAVLEKKKQKEMFTFSGYKQFPLAKCVSHVHSEIRLCPCLLLGQG